MKTETEFPKDRIRIGQRIATLRTSQGITQRQLAQRCSITQPHLARIEQGKYSVGLDTLSSIAEALGAQVELITKES